MSTPTAGEAKLSVGRARVWLQALALLTVSQLMFFVGLGAGERAVLPGSLSYAPDVEVLASTENNSLALAPVRVPLHPVPGYRYVDPQREPSVVFTHRFQATPGDDSLGVYLSWKRRVAEVRLNGQTLTAQLPSELPGAAGGFDPTLFALPNALLLPGENTLEFRVLGSRLKILPAFFVGTQADHLSAYWWSRLISVELPVAAIGIMLFIGLLVVAIPWPPADQARARALLVLLLAWSLRNFSFFGLDAALSPVWQQVLHYQITFAFLFALAWFAGSWTGAGRRWTVGYAIGASLLIAAALPLGLVGESRQIFRWLFPLESLLTFTLVPIAIVQFLRYGSAGSWPRRYETILFSICLTSVVVDALDDRFDLRLPFSEELFLTFYAAPVCGLLLALGGSTVLIGQSVRARRLMEQLNRVLDQRLAAQEVELRAGHQREQEESHKRTVLEERQRLMRDMHDGLGGQLVSLLVRLRGGQASTDDAAQEVARALDDLRLIVSSLDHADESIGLALGGFRERIEPSLTEAGLELSWVIDADAANERLSVDGMLNVLRFLQEAFSNVLRHAQATSVAVRLSTETVGMLSLAVADNGRGLPRHPSSGRGLKNMTERAHRLGGELLIESVEPGTKLTMNWPRAG
ncbi:MAG: ATP-binding protein [Pseudomonadota bacterium]